jgi:endonuclease/exonuclease/phosphatase family metal-dependent hydrolase
MRRSLLALVMSATLVLGVGGMPAAAARPSSVVGGFVAPAAKLVKPTIRVQGSDTSLTVSWNPVPKASGYRIEYSTKKSMASAKKVTVGASTSSKLIKGVKNDVKLHVRVRALGTGSIGNSLSTVKTAMPDSGTPKSPKITVTSAGRHKIKVSWTGLERATKVGVLAGSDSIVTKNLFTSKWYPATTTSITLVVPERLREEMGTGSGNPIHVKVAAYNSLKASDSMPKAKNLSKSYRLSPAGTYAFASALPATGDLLRVATWNVRSAGTSVGEIGYTWKDRRLKVRNGILASDAALVGLQEINTGDAGLGDGLRQWQDLHDLLEPEGWDIANDPNDYRMPTNSTNGAHLFYRTAELEVLDGGFVSPRGSGISWPSAIKDRHWSWAQFRVRGTGAEFYAASVHLPVDDNGNNREKLRVAIATSVDRFLTERADGAPIVILGDLNSTVLKSSTGADNALRVAGYYDAASAKKRINYRYATVNHVGQLDNLGVKGYPFTPYKNSHVGSRIDYIMVKNSPGAARYENQMILTSTGKFDRDYQGSDHNLQWAEIGIPAP